MSLSAFVRGLISRSIELLGPPNDHCLVCGGLRRGRPVLPHGAHRLGDWLCMQCSARIPWIHRCVCPRCGRPEYCPDCVRRPNRAFIMNRSAVQYDDMMREWLAMYKYRGDERCERVLAEMILPAYERLTAEASIRDEEGRGALAPHLAQTGRSDSSRINAAAAKCFSAPGRLRGEPRQTQGSRPAMSPNYSGRPHRKRGSGRTREQVWHAVTYVPISPERAEERGFNQAERLARAAAERAGAPLLPLLRRMRDSGKQSQRSRAERLRAMRAAFGPDETGVRQLAAWCGSRRSDPAEPIRILLVDDIYTTGSTAEACAETIRAASPVPASVYVLTWARS